MYLRLSRFKIIDREILGAKIVIYCVECNIVFDLPLSLIGLTSLFTLYMWKIFVSIKLITSF